MPSLSYSSVRFSSNPPIAELPGRILIADPSECRQEILRGLLEPEGYQLITCEGDEVTALSLECDPDLILMALELSSASAFEVCAELRAATPNRHVPIVLVADSATEETVAQGLLAGADDFVTDLSRVVEARARIRVQLRNKRFYDTVHRVRNERDSLRRDAQVDPLTGLLNRRSIEAHIMQRWQARERFGVLFIDIDHFKSVNDTFGHEMGDRVLNNIATVLKNGLRPGDVVGRYGGEEFVAVVLGAGPESARIVAERLRVAVETTVLPERGPKQITISVGTTVFDPRQMEESPQQLLHRADMALYSAKRAGRNRVVMVPAGQRATNFDSIEPPFGPSSSLPAPTPSLLRGDRLRSG
jgi:two-component system cell cycle response regulator